MAQLCLRYSPARCSVERLEPQREYQNVNVFLLSRRPEETKPLMATDATKATQRLTELEGHSQKHADELVGLRQAMTTVNATVQSLSERAVTSWQLITRFLVPVLLALVGIYFTLSSQFNSNYTDRLPKEIEYGIASSPSLKDKFSGVDNRLNAIDNRLEKIDAKLDEVSRTLALFANTSTISSAILDATSAPPSQLAKSIPRIQSLFEFAKNSRAPLPTTVYARASQNLFKNYAASSGSLKNQLWSLLTLALTTKSSTDVALSPVSDSRIDEAKRGGNLFEGEIDLSQRTEWKDAIFREAKISISKPDTELILDQVRFIDCDFQSLPEHEDNQKLVQTILASTSPEVRVAINSFRVLKPRYEEKSPDSASHHQSARQK
jgi:hypothetical protein